MKKKIEEKKCICLKPGHINLKCPVHTGVFKIDEKLLADVNDNGDQVISFSNTFYEAGEPGAPGSVYGMKPWREVVEELNKLYEKDKQKELEALNTLKGSEE